MTAKKEKSRTGKEEEYQKRIKELEQEKEDLTDTLQRLQAEFENYQKRVEKQKAEFCNYAKAEIIEKVLPVLDNFEIVLKNKDKEKDFVKGAEMIYAELISMLQKEGIRHIDAVGKKIDPNFHEVLLTEKSDKEEGTVIEELQKGYMLNDKVLRYSKVKVAKK